MNLNPLAAEEQFLKPLDRVNGFDIRPGLYEINGAAAEQTERESASYTVYAGGGRPCKQ